MLSKDLEISLHRALDHANDLKHEFATLEHLLLALTEDKDAIAVFTLRQCLAGHPFKLYLCLIEFV